MSLWHRHSWTQWVVIEIGYEDRDGNWDETEDVQERRCLTCGLTKRTRRGML